MTPRNEEPSSLRATPAERSFTCLIVDDDRDFAQLVRQAVEERGGVVQVRHCLKDAREVLQASTFDFVVLDNRLPDGIGYEFYSSVAQRCPDAVVIMMTGMPELSQAVILTRNGLFDYLTKPVNTEDLSACLGRVAQRLARPTQTPGHTELIGSSPAANGVTEHLRQIARHSTATVLLWGETGTGKDLAARVLHQLTHPDDKTSSRYVAVNCAAVPQEMFEAELFGSERGAYTGADKRRVGLAEAAENGTLFLDEITEVPIALQAKLLRFLESREYRLLGNTATKKFTGRIVAATNRSLPDEVRAGRFREDLMYRLDVNSVRLPPLRERLADIEPLAQFLLTDLCSKYERRLPSLRPDDLQSLKRHSFPGNVRELRNLLERSLLKGSENDSWMKLDLGWLRDRSLGDSTAITPPAPAANPDARTLPPLDLQEYEAIRKVLTEESGAIRRSAQRLGITHQALLRRLQKWPELRNLIPPA